MPTQPKTVPSSPKKIDLLLSGIFNRAALKTWKNVERASEDYNTLLQRQQEMLGQNLDTEAINAQIEAARKKYETAFLAHQKNTPPQQHTKQPSPGRSSNPFS